MWHDAAWACRPDGKSQGGWLVAATEFSKAMKGEPVPFSVIGYGSDKLPRVARSSLSAETQAATEAEGELYYTRLT